MKMIAEEKLASGQKDIVVSLHSTSLVYQGNPYSGSQKEIEATFARLMTFIRWLKDTRDVEAVTASGLYSRYRRNRGDRGPSVH
jgi:hypothetical protein